jgi:ABC-type transport system involved in cytochrome c biogenesis permease subunit
MRINFTIQHLLIYQTMMLYLLAWAVYVLKYKKTGIVIYALGFAVAAISVAYRWINVGHIPLQNLFEVFLFLGLLVFPLTLASRKILNVGGAACDMILGIIVLFPAGFVFSAEPKYLPPVLQSWLFAPHVAIYTLAYIIMTKAACQGLGGLINASAIDHEFRAYKLVCLGFPLLTLGIVLGSFWGKIAWGDYWNWDPKEMWSLATWLVFIGYFHYRYMTGVKYLKINCLWIVTGFAFIVITLLWVNLSRIFIGLHNYAL